MFLHHLGYLRELLYFSHKHLENLLQESGSLSICVWGLLHNQCWVTGKVLIIYYILEDDDYFDFILAFMMLGFRSIFTRTFPRFALVSIRNYKESCQKIYVYFQQFLVIGRPVHISVVYYCGVLIVVNHAFVLPTGTRF